MHAELRIEISRLGNRYLAITRRNDGQEILSNEFRHDFSSVAGVQPQWLLRTRGRPRSQPESRGRSNPSQAAADGRRLYRYLFGNGKGLRAYFAEHEVGAPCLLTLSIGHEAYPLWRLPWEYLFDGRQFLCLDGTFMLSRRPADLRTLSPQPELAPLRVLAIIANPEDQTTFDAAAVSGSLLESVEPLISQGVLDLEILTEPTSSALLTAVRARPYQAIHFFGHGVYHLAQNQGFLCFEDDVARTALLSGAQLPRYFDGGAPRLLLISACPSAQAGAPDAFTGVAEALLDHDLPGVVVTPAHLDAPAATAFLRATYSALATGLPVCESLQKGRLALSVFDEDKPPDQQPFNWGLPALYLRAPDLRLVDPEIAASADEPIDEPSALAPATDHAPLEDAIGRKHEIQTIRKALRAGDRVFGIWGSEGVGKHHLVSQLLERWSPKPSAILRIECRTMVEPLAVLGQIADFWRGAEPGTGLEAADVLLDLRLNPYERARAAMQQMSGKRHVLVFEGIDAWFEDDTAEPGSMADATVRDVILGLLSVPGRTTFFFTGARRWADLAKTSAEKRREVQIPLLPLQPTIRIMHRWPELRQLSSEQKQAVYWHLGGHPEALQLLAGWVRTGGDLASLLTKPPIADRATHDWIVYLIRGILAQLDPGEYDVLRSLAILRRPFSADFLSRLTPVAAGHAERLARKWQHLGLIRAIHPADPASLTVQPTAQRIIVASLSANEARLLHLKAATHYAAPLVDAARRQILARNITGWSQERIAWLASDANGVLGLWLRQPPEGVTTAAVLERAIAWQYHLALAGAAADAAHIVRTITPELNRQGQRDLAAKLAQQTVGAPALGQAIPDSGVSVGASPRAGDLTSAAQACDRARDDLDPKASGIQRADLLMRLAESHRQMGHRQAVVQHLREACQILQHEHDSRSEAECLHKLAVACRELPDHRQALVYSQAALELFESLTLPHGLACAEREQGQILRELGYLDQALERFAASLRTYRALDDRAGIVANLMDIGLLFERLGKTDMAIQVIEEALEQHEYLRSPDHGEVLSLLERFYAQQQRLNEAMARFRTARHDTAATL
ncbi:MAG: CHAT domain-containing protein [Anaerolineae bacterium]|nr:CHAT domain-containing protein [Anaerolineae bacterium]